jgi:CheY-like chemotaxis protein
MRQKRINLPYARVLVVDDNITNLDVAKGLMKPYGMNVDCVTSGQQAVDAIRAGELRSNAVFMDHMMPGMDGIEAVRAIREIDTDYAKNIPIIALTANAIVGNEELFLNKGFQAFLSKPIDISRLDEVIRNWVRDKNQEKLIASGSRSRKPAGLDIKKGIKRFGGDEELYLDVLRSYVLNTGPLLQSLEKLSGDNLPDYAVTVHGIKGASLGIFADMIGSSAEALENAAKAGDYEYVKTHNRTFIGAVRKLICDLEDMLSAADAENIKPGKDKPDVKMLSKLLAACESYDMDGVDSAMEEIESYQYESNGELVLWLR